MSSTAFGGTSYQVLNNSLQGPLLVLQMLSHITSKDTTLKNQNAALADIKFLQNYINDLNRNEVNKVKQEKVEFEKCQEDLQQIIANENEDLKTCTFVMDAVTRDDKEGCILRHLVMNNNIAAVEALLKQYVNINGVCNGSSILHAAAATNNEYLIQLILDKGAEVNKMDNDGLTPVQRAAMEGQDKAVNILAGRSTVKTFGTSKNRLSHLAAKAGHVSVLETLKSLYPKMLQEKNRFKQTPLIVAAANGHLNAVKVLIDMGANPNEEDRFKDTALHKAAEGKHDDVVDYLLSLKNIDVDKPNSSGNTPLHLALLNGQEDIVSKLMNAKAYLWLEGEGGNTALHFAAHSNMDGFLKRLLNAGADVNIRNKFDETPLHQAARANSTKTAIVLIRYGAIVNAKNNNLETPLHVAALNNAKEVAEELLKNGAYRLAKDKLSNTPIGIAEIYKYFEIAYILK